MYRLNTGTGTVDNASLGFGHPTHIRITNNTTLQGATTACTMRMASVALEVSSRCLLAHDVVIRQVAVPMVGTDNQDSVLSVFESTQQTIAAGVPILFLDATRLQRVGETMFAAAFFVALLQAVVAFFSYRTNPVGELVVPPGPTVGVELPLNMKRDRFLPFYAELFREQLSTKGEGSSSDVTETSPKKSTGRSRYSNMINRANRLLPLLLPWLTRNLDFVLARNTHLFHIGFVGFLIQMFDFPARLFLRKSNELAFDFSFDGTTNIASKNLDDLKHVCVIGDSLVVGLGTVDVFDKNKNSTLAKYRIEQLASNAAGAVSPEFPRVFAQTLATLRQAPVTWRSAGVDGGTVQDIAEFCFGIIQEQAEAGCPPDVVVIVCGMNDLKQFITNPWGGFSARTFRRSLIQLISDIRQVSPGCKVIVPAIPTQMFNKNSLLNIFPLGFFLDTIVGFFDSQKKLVADNFPSKDVMYLGLKVRDIGDWYQDESKSLLASDGVHPNKRCYARWANAMANGLCATLLPTS
jgi:lysophospholipase L1-like esterase